MKSLKPFIKTSHENWSYRNWIVSHFPEGFEDLTYIEPFGGTANVLFAKNKSRIEVINDNDAHLTTIYKALRDEGGEFIRRLGLHKYSEETFEKISKKKSHEDYLEHAVHEFLTFKMTRNNDRKSFNKLAKLETWKGQLKTLVDYSARLKEVYIFNKTAFEILAAFNHPESLIYIDPPYLHENKVSSVMYTSDMSPETHMEMYRILNNHQGKIVLSGCMSPLYKRIYKNWNMSKKRIDKGKEKRTEIIWKNF